MKTKEEMRIIIEELSKEYEDLLKVVKEENEKIVAVNNKKN